MAKPGAKEESAGMDRAEIKRHLRFAREEPIPVAFALGGDGKAVLQFDRRKPGRALERQLKEEAPDSKNHRWGTALVDPDNPKLVRFTVNKAGGGMARRLIVALKGTGFSKVKIVLDDGTELEAHEEEDEDAPEEENGAAAPRQAPEPDPSQTGAEPQPATEATSPEPAAQPDAAALTRDLTGLVKRMLGVIAKDPTQKAALAELATDAQASLKRGDLAQASAGIDILRQAIEAAEAGASAGPARPGPEKAPAPATEPTTEPAPGAVEPAPNGAADGVDIRKEAEALLATVTRMVKQLVPFLGTVPGLGEMVKEIAAAAQASIKAGDLDRARGLGDQLREILGGIGAPGASSPPAAAAAQPKPARAHAKARQAWVATRKKVADEVDKLHDTFSSAIDGHGMADQLAKTFRERVDGVLETLDESLAHTLEAVDNATDEAERAKLVQQAHATVQRYQAHIASDPIVAMLDRNPFVPLSIQKTMTTTLSALSKAIR